jgi:hypothetical protein
MAPATTPGTTSGRGKPAYRTSAVCCVRPVRRANHVRRGSQSAYQNLGTSRIASSHPLSDPTSAANIECRSQRTAIWSKNRNHRRSDEAQKAPPVDSLQHCGFSRYRSRTVGPEGARCASDSATRFDQQILPPLGNPGTAESLGYTGALVRLGVPAQPVDPKPSNGLIRQCFP